MKQGITITRDRNYRDAEIVRIVKRRGLLTLEEVCDLLTHESCGSWCGHYAIVLNCSESAASGSGFDFGDEPKGDALDLYPLEEYGECPICGEMLPPADYCPECGTSWKDSTKDIEKLIASMWDETKRNLDRPNATPSQRAAWYYSHLGSLDMARQIGAITEKRRQELYDEARTHYEGAAKWPRCSTEAGAGSSAEP